MEEPFQGEGSGREEIEAIVGGNGEEGESWSLGRMGEVGGWDEVEDGVSDGGEKEESEGEDHHEAGEVIGFLDLGPEELDSEAAAFAIADLFFNGHAAVVEGGEAVER